MEAAKPNPGGVGERHGRCPAPILAWLRPPISRSGASALHRSEGLVGVRAGWLAGGRAIRAADGFRLCGGRSVSALAHSLDVVAGHRRPCHWAWRLYLSAGAWRMLPHPPPAVARGWAAPSGFRRIPPGKAFT